MGEKVIREGSWICPNCQAKNRGTKENCDSCGAVRGNVQFIYEEQGQAVTDATGIAKAKAGPDWVCAFCGDSNAFDRTTCQGCSAPKSEGKQREVKEATVKGGEGSGKKYVNPHATSTHEPNIEPVRVPLPMWFKAGLGIFLFGFAVLMGLQCLSFEDSMTVAARQWRRAITVLEYQTVREGAWRGELPPKAREIGRQEKIRSYKDVLTGYRDVQETYTEQVQVGTKRVKTGVRDLGNGQFEETWEDQPVYEDREKTRTVQKPVYRQDPVYDTWIDYDVDKWRETGKPTAEGTTDEPRWPETGAAASPQEVIGAKREGPREEHYQVTLKSDKDGKEHKLEELNGKPLTFEAFSKLKQGEKFKVTVSGLGIIKEIPAVMPVGQ